MVGMCLDAAQRAKVPAYAQKSGFGIRPHSSAAFGTLRYRVSTVSSPGGAHGMPDRLRAIEVLSLSHAAWSGARSAVRDCR